MTNEKDPQRIAYKKAYQKQYVKERSKDPKFQAYRRECARRNGARLKFVVFSHYSNGKPKCKCCGETEMVFLALDHINGGGKQHRKEIFNGRNSGGRGYYSWLKRNNYPEGYQILCHNCNFAKGDSGKVCPHQLGWIKGGLQWLHKRFSKTND